MNQFAHKKNNGFKRTNWKAFEEEVVSEMNKSETSSDTGNTTTIQVTHDSEGKPYKNKTWIQVKNKP